MISSRKLLNFFVVFFSLATINSRFTASGLGEIAESGYLYSVQIGTPLAIQNFIKPEKNCDWLGVAGQVFDPDGLPVNGLVVKVYGYLQTKVISQTTTTGSSAQMGPGGFDLQLADKPIESLNSLYIQLLGTGGLQLSEQHFFNTYASCEKNLILINFTGVNLPRKLFFPIVLSR